MPTYFSKIFFGKFLLFLSAHFFLACATTSVDESNSNIQNSKLSKEDEEKLKEYKAEVILGKDMAGRLLQYYGTYGDEELVKYINRIGTYVGEFSDHPERKYMFAILDTDAVNAFACPGGYILITLGTIRHAKSEAELAMVLGHEIAHVGKKHMFNTLINMEKKELEKEAKDAESKGKVKISYEMAVRARPKAENSDSAALISRYLSQSAGAGMTLLRAAKAGMNVLLESGLDKELEYEADLEGSKYAIAAGYNPSAFTDFLDRLDKKKNKKFKTKVLEKTHPSLKNRKSGIKKLLIAMDAKKIVGADGTSRFKQYTKDLPKLVK